MNNSPVEEIKLVTSVLKIKIGACLTGPTRRLLADLKDTARTCNRARNAMVQSWLRWRWEHPDWTPPVRTNEDGTPKLRRNGQPILDQPAAPRVVTHEGQLGEFIKVKLPGRKKLVNQRVGDKAIGVSFGTYLYHAGRAVTPNLSTSVCVQLSKDVWGRLTDDLPYNHGGEAQERWEGILKHEVNPDTYRTTAIPVMNNNAGICYLGHATQGVAKISRPVSVRVQHCGKSSAVLVFPMFSESSGREWKEAIVRLEVRQLSKGNRLVMLRIARGDWKLCDSEIVYREKSKGGRKRGDWFFMMTYEQPEQDLGLDVKRTATLNLLSSNASHPMQIAAEDAFPWTLGDVGTFTQSWERLENRRLGMRSDYSVGGPGSKGHGRARYERDINPVTRGARNIAEKFSQGVIAQILKYCIRNNCGRIVYREPTGPLRLASWFSARNVSVPFDWSRFRPNLEHKCKLHKITLVVEREGMKEFRERTGGTERTG